MEAEEEANSNHVCLPNPVDKMGCNPIGKFAIPSSFKKCICTLTKKYKNIRCVPQNPGNGDGPKPLTEV